MTTFKTGSALIKLLKARVAIYGDLESARTAAALAANTRDALQVQLSKKDFEIQNLLRQLPQ